MIYVDADACPVRDEVLAVAERHGVRVVYVTNGGIRPSRHPLASVVVVDQGADAADRWIAERIGPGDVCVTADVPLAARCVERGARALAPDGAPFTRAERRRAAGAARPDGRPARRRSVPAGRRAAVRPGRPVALQARRSSGCCAADRRAGEEGAVAVHRQERERGRDRHPDRVVAGLGRRAVPAHRAGEVDVADLVRPEVVLRHEGEALPGAEPADARAMRQPVSSRHSRCSARSGPSPGSMPPPGSWNSRLRRRLLGDEHVVAVADHRVGAGALAVAAGRDRSARRSGAWRASGHPAAGRVCTRGARAPIFRGDRNGRPR